MATTPIHVARPHEFLKRLPTALVVSVGLLAVAAVPSTAGASLSPKKHSQPATPIASITPPLRQYSDTLIIVSFKGGVPREAMQNAERGIGARELSSLHVGSAYVLTVQSGHVLDSIRALKSHPAVRYAEPDYLLQLAAVPNDPSFPIQWAYRNTGQFVNGTSGTPNADEKATPAWSLTPKNAVVIAETDTGMDYTHPDLAGRAAWRPPRSRPEAPSRGGTGRAGRHRRPRRSAAGAPAARRSAGRPGCSRRRGSAPAPARPGRTGGRGCARGSSGRRAWRRLPITAVEVTVPHFVRFRPMSTTAVPVLAALIGRLAAAVPGR